MKKFWFVVKLVLMGTLVILGSICVKDWWSGHGVLALATSWSTKEAKLNFNQVEIGDSIETTIRNLGTPHFAFQLDSEGRSRNPVLISNAELWNDPKVRLWLIYTRSWFASGGDGFTKRESFTVLMGKFHR